MERYKQRPPVECGVDRLKRDRPVTARYDKLAVRYEATSTSPPSGRVQGIAITGVP
jgi:transposase